jgi:hypothetical protein
MKTNLLLVLVIGWAILAEAGTNEIPTFTISAEDVIQSSIYVHPVSSPYGTNRFTVKFQYTETGSNRARAFTEAHQNQVVRDKIGEFSTPGGLLRFTNTSGRNGYHGISAKDADAIVSALKK